MPLTRSTVLAAPFLVLVLVLAAPAVAHPGHGGAEGGLLHYVTEPVHAAFALLVLAVGVAALGLARVPGRERARRRR